MPPEIYTCEKRNYGHALHQWASSQWGPHKTCVSLCVYGGREGGEVHHGRTHVKSMYKSVTGFVCQCAHLCLHRSLSVQSWSLTELFSRCFARCHSSDPSCLLNQLLICHKLRGEFAQGIMLGLNLESDMKKKMLWFIWATLWPTETFVTWVHCHEECCTFIVGKNI